MICKITGKLESLTTTAARVDTGQGMTYEVLLPAHTAVRLGGEVGRAVAFHTIHYLEGTSQGSNFTPRLAGFLSETDREFFTLFTSVKGIGPRKAMRAMAVSSGQIAAAVADRDLKMLQSLPEIGRRMAETVVATLSGKVDKFLGEAAYGVKGSGGEAGAMSPAAAPAGRGAAREALEVLLQLGENRAAAVQWIDEILIKQPDIDDPQELITAVLRLKTGK